MRIISFISKTLLLVMLIAVISIPAFAETKLVEIDINGDFKDVDEETGIPIGWTFHDVGLAVEEPASTGMLDSDVVVPNLDDEDAPPIPSFRVETSELMSFGGIISDPIPLKPNTNYRFVAWLKIEDVVQNPFANSIPARIYWSVPNGAWNVTFRQFGTIEWTCFTKDFTTTIDTTSTTFTCYIYNAKGVAWFGGLKLYEIVNE